MTTTTTIKIRRQKVASRGIGYAWYWHYYFNGPDGREVGGYRTKDETRYLVRKLYGREAIAMFPGA